MHTQTGQSSRNKKPSTSNSSLTQHDNELVQVAAQWHVVMHSGEVTLAENTEFSLWYKVSENANAYDKFTDIWNRFEAVENKPARLTIHKALKDNKSNKTFANSVKTITLCGVVLGLSAYLLANTFFGKAFFSDHYALTNKLTTINLSDNSQIKLSPFSAVNIVYSDNTRNIELLAGRVMIDVAKDANRPLTISSQHGTARALGTQFSMADLGDYSEVSVYESKVEVCSSANKYIKNNQPQAITTKQINHKINQQCEQLSPGQTSKLTRESVEKPKIANNGWHINVVNQTLVVDDQPLINVLNELKAHHFGYMKINAPALQNISVSGVFPLNNIDHTLTVISASLPIKVSRYSPLFINIDKKINLN